jgi:hypothetical protein
MDWFQTKNPNWGKFWSALDWKLLIYFMANWNILLRFGKFYGRLVHFVSCDRKNLATLGSTIESTFRAA